MSTAAPAPGWYPDPWKQGELRWHDGSEWTAHVHGTAPVETTETAADEPPPISPDEALLQVLGALPPRPPEPRQFNRTATLAAGLFMGMALVALLSVLLSR